MKAILIILAALVSLSTAQESAPVIDYPMRDIPKDDPRFKAAFQSVVAYLTPSPEKTAPPGPANEYRPRPPESDAVVPKSPPKGVKPPATLVEFSDRLQMGEFFFIEKGTATIYCKACNGAGRIPVRTSVRRPADGKIECLRCQGTGKRIIPQQVRIKWK